MLRRARLAGAPDGRAGHADAEHPAPRCLRRRPHGLLAVYSLSKQSNLAGYRAAFVAGDPALVGRLLEVRKHAGMIVPAPVQAAMAVALRDDTHVRRSERLRARRTRLLAGADPGGLRVDESEAGLYLWATRDEDRWDTVAYLADLGILVAPGTFYGPAGDRHVRIALTATDERIAAAATGSDERAG